MNSPQVAILLALYNGEPYLRGFLDSLAAQSKTEFVLLVRDDGSVDKSVDVVLGYADRLNIKFVDSSERVGPAENFRLLLAAAGSKFEAYMFADQDDLWMSEKIERAWTRVRDCSCPCLYLTAFDYTDADGDVIRRVKPPTKIGPMNAVVQSIGPGCSMAINQQARELLLGLEIPAGVMHDRWFYFVLSLKGVVTYDDDVNLRYRLHESNAVGAPRGPFSALRRRVYQYFCGGSGGVYSAFPLARGALNQLDLSCTSSLKTALQLLLDPPPSRIRSFVTFMRLPFERQSWVESFLTRVALFSRRH